MKKAGLYDHAVSCGIVKDELDKYFQIYQSVMKQQPEIAMKKRYGIVAAQFGCSVRTVERALFSLRKNSVAK